MTEISLPYDQVCEIIAETAELWRTDELLGDQDRQRIIRNQARRLRYEQFGHKLLRALEEAHLARRGKERAGD